MKAYERRHYHSKREAQIKQLILFFRISRPHLQSYNIR